ncbi:MAG: glutathione peroxidase [Bacteroidia bacterium]|nr:glutathione peroxidase [Bacteroidia bacterium]MCZ2276625.1 glutathione peroxidase [Bacteroidia bacterium]
MSQNHSIYDIKVKTIDDQETTLAAYKGRKMLIVNVASRCGNTPQYTDLEKLYKLHGDKVTVLGFPANNFLGQEPGSNKQIKEFCTLKYGVTFPMFSKISVKGKDQSPLYQWLTDPVKNGWNDKQPDWNFAKYLVDENGKLTDFFPAKTQPMDEVILLKIS